MPNAMDLRDKFARIPPREKAGQRSSDRFAYQRNWAFCRLLELHEGIGDYLIAFDLHEDVIVFDSEEAPTAIWFYQIKTKKGDHWTVGDLLRPRQCSKLSPLAKLYTNYLLFPDTTKELAFVSNAIVKVSYPGETLNRVAFKNLDSNEQARMVKAVREQCEITADPDLNSYMWFELSPLSLDDHVEHATGKLTAFLERLHPTKKLRAGAAFKTIATEIERRNNYVEPLQDFAEVRTKKGIGRSGFDEFLQQMGMFEDFDAHWNRIESRLNSEGISFTEVQSLRDRFFTLEAKRTERANTVLFNMHRGVQAAVKAVLEAVPPTTLQDIVEEVVNTFKAGGTDASVFDDFDLKAMALICIYEARKLPSSN